MLLSRPPFISMRFGIGLLAGLLLAQSSVLRAATPLFADGQTVWRICIADASEPAVLYAVEELTNALKKVSNVDFPVQIGSNVPASDVIVIGDLTHPLVQQHQQALNLTSGDVEQASVKTIGDRLFLAGNQPRGALYAVYTFLNRELNVRWLWPGKSGEFMPARAQYSLPSIDVNHTPGYRYRGFHLCGDWRDHQIFRIWMGRNFINIHWHAAPEHEKRLGFHSMWSSHNAHLKASEYFEEHPEYFAELNGQRYPSSICMSNPEVLELVAEKQREYLKRNPQLEILSIFPSDNQDYCQCEACAQTDVATGWFNFYNQLTDILKVEYPKLKFATIAYQGYREVPACEIRNTHFVEYATYGRCNVHPFTDTDCTRSAHVLEAFDAWEQTGVPIGNYGYEFDIFTHNGRFTPFFTMIEDAIREGHRRQQIALITEVILSPNTGPDTSVYAVQNRLPLYLYAQLMWDPSRSADDLLAEWCQTAYADAAQPMLDYFRSMNASWTAMGRHPGILGDAMSVVDAFITETLQASVQNAFDAAETALEAQEPSTARARALEAFDREHILYKQWQDLADLKSGGVPIINAPLLTSRATFTDTVCRPVQFPSNDVATATDVRVAWTKDALHLRWRCGEPQPNELRALAAGRDQGVLDDDAVEVEISSGITGERYFLAVNTLGIQADVRHSTVGVMEPQWNPAWQSHVTVSNDHWEARFEIPFSAIGGAPELEANWQIRFRRTSGGRAGRVETIFPESMPAMLFFNGSAATGRQLLYWSGAPAREAARDPILKQSFMSKGWDLHICSTQETLLATHPIADAFWFRHPNGFVKIPEDYWDSLVSAVSNGAVAAFISYFNIPLERYFNDPSFKVSTIEMRGLPLSGRKTTFIAPGEWGSQPYKVSNSLARGYSPCYGHIPTDTNAWTVLAIAPNDDGKDPFPYLLARRYGRGLIVLGGDAIPAAAPEMLENFLHWNTQMQLKLPNGKLQLDPDATNWLSGWNSRKAITINHQQVDGDLTNFPTLVRLTASTFNFDRSAPDGSDIRFTWADGETPLAFERETHDATSKTAAYWVNIPRVSASSDTIFYLYSGKSGAADGSTPATVWDSGHVAVWHLHETNGVTQADSTAAGNNLAVGPAGLDHGDVAISDCDSTTGWSFTGPAASLAVDTLKRDTIADSPSSIQLTVATTETSQTNTLVYKPSAPLALGNRRLDFYLNTSKNLANGFSTARVYLYDTDGNYRYHNLTVGGENGNTRGYGMTTKGTTGGTAPDVNAIDRIEWVLVSANNTPYTLNIDTLYANGALKEGSAGAIAQGVTFSGNDHYLITAAANINTTNGLTSSAWVRQRDIQNYLSRSYVGIVNIGGGNLSPYYHTLLGYYKPEKVYGLTSVHKSVNEYLDAAAYNGQGTGFTTGVWHHVAGVYHYDHDASNTTVKVYVDGVKQIDQSVAGRALRPILDKYVCVGAVTWSAYPGDDPIWRISGDLDEVRISNVTRSEAWLKASFQNQKAKNSLLTIGRVEPPLCSIFLLR